MVLILAGCQTAQEIGPEREVEISNMDNLDICYNLGRQDDFEYWKMIKTEQAIRSSVTMTWDVSDEICNQAQAMGREALARIQQKKQKRKSDLIQAINDAGNSIGKGYENAAKAYGSVNHTNCQVFGSVTNCKTY